jgi:hypothetical protein
MALPFRRSPRPLFGKNSPRAQRHWEVQVLLSTLHPAVRSALQAWLLGPTDPERWPPPDTIDTQRAPISEAERGDGQRPTASRLLRAELRAIRHTLDLPPDALSGLTRNGLLTVHAIRLRQLEHWLWPFYAAREIKRLTT